MAVLDFRGSGTGESGFSLTGKVSRMVNVIGALTSVLLILMLVVWGYRLVVRDVTGIPVIKAMEGPARTAPEEPGGDLARNTGLAVNQVAADNPPAASQEPLVLAPAATPLANADVPMGMLGATAHEPANPTPTAALLPPEEDPKPLTDAEIAARLAVAPTDGLAPASDAPITEAVTAVAPPSEAERVAEAEAAPAPVDVKSATDAAVAAALATPRPAARPADPAPSAPAPAAVASVETPAAAPAPTAETPAPVAKTVERPAEKPAEKPAAKTAEKPADKPAEKAVAKTAEKAPEVKSASVSSGAQLAQIGAFDNEEQARTQWARVSKKFGPLMAGKEPVLQQHTVNGRTFVRLRVAGFGSGDDARSFCESLAAGGTDCMPAKAK